MNLARIINSIMKTLSGDTIEMIAIQSQYFMCTYQIFMSSIWAPLQLKVGFVFPIVFILATSIISSWGPMRDLDDVTIGKTHPTLYEYVYRP